MNFPTARVLVVRRGALGDLILTLPFLSALKVLYPKASIHLLGPARLWSVVASRGGEQIHDLEDLDLASLYVRGKETSCAVRRFFAFFDRIFYIGVDPEGTIRDHLERCAPRRGRIISPFPPAGVRVHASDHLVCQLSELGFREGTPLPLVCPEASEILHGSRILGGLDLPAGRPLLAIHPGSGSPRKNWPWKNYREIIRRALEGRLASPLVFLGEAEKAKIDLGDLDSYPGKVPRLCCLPLGRVAGILANCHLYLGNDSGITHLAAALGVKTLVLFLTTDPAVWEPRGSRVTVLAPPSPLPGTLDPSGPEIETVWARLEEALKSETSRC